MLVFPNAKINIGLYITAKREDGFHDIETVFYPIGVYGMLEMIPSKKHSFSISGIEIPITKENNICLKTFSLLQEKYSLPPVKIHLHKNIPIGAGLGGGSSDAAFMLKLTNEIFNLNLSDDEFQNFAIQLGSDVSFFLHNKPVLARGRGEILSEIDLSLNTKYLVVIYPNIHISTRDAYSNIKPKHQRYSLVDLIKEPISEWKDIIFNDFEERLFLRYNALKEIKDELYRQGAIYASMSGSGSSIYGVFDNMVSLKNINPKYYIFQSKLA